MGCFQSKNDCGDIHPNVFRVINVDEAGTDLWSGQLEITETDLILYREGRETTTWPLSSLRRYGFEADIFSFESGRRCVTGEGIFAFRCRRAGMLFRTLQHNIQLRNVLNESRPFQIPPLNASPQIAARQTLQASVVHRSSVDNGLPGRISNNVNNHLPMQTITSSATNQSSRSPSSVDILEVTPLYPRPQSNGQVPNIYQVKDFKSQEHNNNQDEHQEGRHLYSNDLSRELALLRATLHRETALNNIRDMEEERLFLQSRNINEKSTMSPTHSTASEHYAQLTIEQEQARSYMNIIPGDPSNQCDTVPSTPRTPKQPDYCNFNLATKQEMNSYANLTLGDIGDSILSTKQKKFSESDTFTSLSPVEELEVNYAILDMEANKEAAASRVPGSDRSASLGSQPSRCSLEPAAAAPAPAPPPPAPAQPPLALGYTTIDFEKTEALTSVAADTDIDVDGTRRSRHNSHSGAAAAPPAPAAPAATAAADRHRY